MMSDSDRPEKLGQELRHSAATARVPDGVGRGAFANGALVLQGGNEFAIDFLQRLVRPHQIVTRVLLPPPVVPQLLAALSDGLKHYSAKFGPPPTLALPVPPAEPPPLSEVYETLKFPDDVAVGAYANGAFITHSQAEFCLDFILSMFPRSIVTSRVYLAATYVPGLQNSLTQAWEKYRKQHGGAG
jgi:hypothetical protein